MKMTNEELSAVIAEHGKWARGEHGGKTADLSGAYLSGIDLSGADLRWANLRWANLIGADLSGADLRWADLRWANLSRADLRWANLIGADLIGADLSGADLRWANLSRAYLSGANLSGANLSGANLDYSSGIPLHCGGSRFTVDARLMRQFVAHLCTLECDDPEWTALRASALAFAQKSHRAGNLGLLDEGAK